MPSQSFSRRDFLKVAGITLAATAVTCSGLGYAATRQPVVETPALTLEQEKNMNTRILVTYATRAGSTAEIAAAIGKTLGQRGLAVDVKPVKEKLRLDAYQGAIIGSAIRMGSWLPEAVEFVKSSAAALDAMPTALFTVHMLNTGDDEQSRTNRLAYLNAVRPLLKKADEVYFAGKFDFARLSFLDRFIANMVKAKEEDLRDWNKINLWAQAVFA